MPGLESELPPAPCPEKIIIYVDTSADVLYSKLQLNDKEPVASFDRLKKIIRMFVMNREAVALKSVNFAVMVNLGGSPTLFTEDGDVKDIITRLEQFRMQEELSTNGDPEPGIPSSKELDLAEIIRTVTQDSFIHGFSAAVGEIPAFYLTRLIMFITTSRSLITFDANEELKNILANPNFLVDALYLHEEPSDDNLVNENWNTILQLNNVQNGRGYLLESGPDVTDWHNISTLLLANPSLRQPYLDHELRKRGGKTSAVVGVGANQESAICAAENAARLTVEQGDISVTD